MESNEVSADAMVAVESLVRAILEKPDGFRWQTQGLGMMRLYLSREVRLHLWDSSLRTPGVSTMHDHPWHFDSLVVAGRVRQRRFKEETEAPGGWPMHRQKILCGPGGGLCGEKETVFMVPGPEESYGPGESYRQTANEVHISLPEDGTITVVTRRFLSDAEHASVFWPRGEEWVSAEPRDATPEEVASVTGRALAQIQILKDNRDIAADKDLPMSLKPHATTGGER